MNIFMNFLRQYGFYVVLVTFLGYLFGSISFSVIVTRLFKNHEDIRNLGSHNAGFTNVLRSVGILPAILTALGDFGKGVVAILISRFIFLHLDLTGFSIFYVTQYMAYLAGFCCIIGHIYPCFFKFRGGKAVLTSFAMAVMVDWRVALISFGVFLLVLAMSKIISLSSILSALVYPIINFVVIFFSGYKVQTVAASYLIVSTVLSALFAFIIVYKHSSNIERLLSGTEKKFTFNKN